MNVTDLLTELENLGVRLWADEGNLRFRAPRGVLTDARRKALAEHKSEVLRLLERESSWPRLQPDEEGRYERFPLTPVQSAYLLGRHWAYAFGGVACTSYLEVEFPGVEPGRVEAAWNTLIGRHDMLRAVVHADGYQRVLPEVEHYRIPVAHVPDVTGDRLESHLDATRDALTGKAGDTAQWPLFALRITRTGETTILHLALELLVVDAASLQMLLSELDGLVHGDDRPATAAEITFRDYVLAEQQLRNGHRYQRDRRYWLDRIEELPPAPALPGADRDAPAGPVRFDRLHDWLTETELAGLREKARTHGVTVSAVVLAAYAEVVGRWSRHRRFTLNLPLFNRLPLHDQVGTLIGDFTSVNLLAVDLDEHDSFAERVRGLSARLFDDLDHRLFTGLEVLAELTRRAGHPVLMPIVFTSTAGLDRDTEAPAMRGRIRRGLTETPQVWLDCQVTEHAGSLLLAWDVRRDVLPDDVAPDAFTAFTGLVRTLATDGRAWTSRFPVTLPGSQRLRRRSFNDTFCERPARSLHEPVFARAVRTPDAPAVVTSRTVLSFGDLAARAFALAERLRAEGCASGDRVAVVMDKGPEQVVAVLGILAAGGVYLPIDAAQPAARRERILTDAGVRLAVVRGGEDTVADLPVTAVALDLTDDTAPGAETFRPVPVEPTDPAYVIYTSGSTGNPKGVVVSHRAAANTIDDINHRFSVNPADRVLGVANLGFDLSVWDIFGVLAAGGALVVPDADRAADPSYWAELVERHRVTLWNTVPAQLQMLQDYLESEPAADLSSLRLAMLSGDWIPVDLPDRVRGRNPGLRVVSLGGATEAAIWSIWYPIGEVSPDWRSIPYGTPLENQTFHVFDDALQDCPEHVTGELYIGGTGLAEGYLGDERRTAERFIVHPRTGARLYRTGDLGRYLPDGTIEFLGREDSQVKIRGHRVELGEIESALRSHPAVADAAVLAPGEREHRRVVGFAELATGTSSEAVYTEVIAAATSTAAEVDSEIDGADFTTLTRTVDEVAVLSIFAQLRRCGLFAGDTDSHDLAEIASATGVSAKQSGLLRRWMAGLVAADAVHLDTGTGRYRGLIAATDADIQAAWRRIDELDERLGYGSATLDYIRTCSGRLDELLDGRLDVRELLFPGGEFGAAHAVYRENLTARGVHRIVIGAMRAVAATHAESRLRVLEVGAGIAGTSTDVIPALAEFEPDYLFTDLSEFFLSEARQKFADYPWVRYGRFDINVDAREQGMLPNTADVILCANVLHNSRNAGEVLARLREILAPGGWLIFLEPTNQHNYPLLVSMEFEFFSELTRFTDLRKDTDQAFFTRKQWLWLLEEAGADRPLCLPPVEQALATSGQGVFIARFNTGRVHLTADDLSRYLAEQLPGYMVPGHLELLDELPRSANGKTDRATLAAWAAGRDTDERVEVVEEPSDDLERRVAALWGEMLGTDRVGRGQDFYSLGGDSLLLSRMVGRLREREPEAAGLEWQELLRHMLRDATVRGLAAYLRSAADRTTGSDAVSSSIVHLNDAAADGTAADRTTWVLVHAGSGTLQPYQALLPHLRGAHDGPLVGLQVGDMKRYLDLAPETVIDRLAADYTRELLGTGDRFRVIGYCVGGLLATEIARTLTETGATVEDLTVISSYRPPAVHDELMVEFVFALAMGVDLAEAGLPEDAERCYAAIRSILDRTPDRTPEGALAGLDGEFRDVGDRFRALARRSQEDRLAAMHRASTAGGAYNSGSYSLEEFIGFYSVFRQSMHAVSRHRPGPYLGPVTLLRNSESSTLLPGTRADVGEFWQRICVGELTVHDVPGDHFGCVAAERAPGRAALLTAGTR